MSPTPRLICCRHEHESQEAQRESLGLGGIKPEDHVLADPTGTPLNPESITQRVSTDKREGWTGKAFGYTTCDTPMPRCYWCRVCISKLSRNGWAIVPLP